MTSKKKKTAEPGSLPALAKAAEREMIRVALLENANNRTHTAAQLGISRRCLLYKIAEHGLPAHESRA